MKPIHLLAACLLLGSIAGSAGCSRGRMLAWKNRSDPAQDLATVDSSTPPPQATTASRNPAETMLAAATKPAAFSMRAPPNPAINAISLAPSMPTAATMPTLTTLEQGQDLNTIVGQSSGTVVLDFYADWCGPCRKQGQVLHELESVASANRVRIIKVNVDDHPQLARQMKVASLPTLMRLQDGQIVDRRTGLADQRTLNQWMR